VTERLGSEVRLYRISAISGDGLQKFLSGSDDGWMKQLRVVAESAEAREKAQSNAVR